MNDFALSVFKDRLTVRLQAFVVPVTALCMAMLFALLISSVAIGSFDLSVADVWHALINGQTDQTASTIVWELRLPRFFSACLVGAMLALSGALLQGVTRNPLSDPSLVGVSQGASLAVVTLIVMLPGAPLIARPFGAFGGAILAALLIQWVSNGKSSAQSLRFILVGIGVSALISAITTAMLTYGQINRAMEALGWLAGSIHTASWQSFQVLCVGMAVLCPALIWAARPLSALRFGPEISCGLGVRLRRDRFAIITLSVALAAVAVSVAGPLGFIGLIAPRLIHQLFQARPGTHLFLTALAGALIVAAADLIGRTIVAPVQLPAGLVSAVIGAPIFTVLLLRRGRPAQL